MNDIDKKSVVQELSEKVNERLDIHGFYDGMSKSDREKLEKMVISAHMDYDPVSADIDHIQVRFDKWSLPKVTIWTKRGLDISENQCLEDSFFVNGHSYDYMIDIRPF
jgi:hypothetical protein